MAEGNLNVRLSCPDGIVRQTLDTLRSSGNRHTECAVLWLAPRATWGDWLVSEAYTPRQDAGVDFFRIPADAMRELMRHLRVNSLALVAQVHTHPRRAFHSRADSDSSVVRHRGALSIVIPNFAANVSANTFASYAAFFRLDEQDRWMEVSSTELPRIFEIVER